MVILYLNNKDFCFEHSIKFIVMIEDSFVVRIISEGAANHIVAIGIFESVIKELGKKK